MSGAPIQITPFEDLLVWGGIAFLALIYALAGAMPKLFRRRSDDASHRAAR